MKRLLLFIILFSLVPVLHLLAQIAVIPQHATVIADVEINRDGLTWGYFDVYTVPAGFKLKITDVIISNFGLDCACTRLRIGPGANGPIRTGAFVVAPMDAFHHTFATGLTYQAGEVVTIGHGCLNLVGHLAYTLRGYLFTTP